MKHLHFAYRRTSFNGYGSFADTLNSAETIDGELLYGRQFRICLWGELLEIFIHWRRYDPT